MLVVDGVGRVWSGSVWGLVCVDLDIGWICLFDMGDGVLV